MHGIKSQKRSPAKEPITRANRLRISTAQVSDRTIKNEAKNSYNFRTLIGNRVAVVVQDGIVTLSGSVADDEERCLATYTAECLKGVKGVRNELFLSGYGSDTGLVSQIYKHLLTKANVSVESLSVDERSGHIVLRGTVDNPVRRSLIESLSLEVEGVDSVLNKIEIDSSSTFEISCGLIDDASISGLIKSALLLAGFKAKIYVIDGVVFLSGIATSYIEQTAVGEIAQSIKGVKWVYNDMLVGRSNLPF